MTSPTPGRVWRLDLPWTSPPLSLNGRLHWSAKQRLTREVRTTTALLCRQAKIPPLARVRIELHYRPRDRRRRDTVNLTLTVKAIEDGVVDAGVIPDDTPDLSEPCPPVLDPPDPTPGTVRLYVLITELPALPDAPDAW
jgi:crossover junction endodeoxyribonuclease RusA